MKRKNSRTKYIILFTILTLLVIISCIGYYKIIYVPKEFSPLYDAVYEKVKDAHLSKDEINTLCTQLSDSGFTIDTINDLDPLMLNQSNQTYGPEALGADLVKVISDTMQDGYVYKQELDLAGPGESISVYQSDGLTIIGSYTPNQKKETNTSTHN